MTQPIILELKPQRRQLSGLSEAISLFPDLQIPRPLPQGASLELADWQYPPRVTHQFSNGKVVDTSVDTNVAPSLKWGHVQLLFRLGNGYFVIDQGQFAQFGLGHNRQLGAPISIRLLNGRTAFTRRFRSADTGDEEVHVIGWGGQEFNLSIWSTVLDLQALQTIAEATR